MRLSKEDKYEFARAAIKARDLESLRDYIVSLIDAMDDLPEGKYDTPVPRYVAPDANGHATPHPDHGTLFANLPPERAA